MKKILIGFLILLFSTELVYASDLSFSAPKEAINGKDFSLLVKLDTGGVSINSFDITIGYPSEMVTFAGYKEEGTIKKSWFKTPKDENGEINFIGLIPNGVEGIYDPDKKDIQPIPIINLVFKPRQIGQAEFYVKKSDIRENDGLGTPFSHKRNNLTLSIIENIDKESKDKGNADNNNPPLPFDIEFIEASMFSKTPSIIIFSTSDQESGIKKYELKKGKDRWKEVISPMQTARPILSKTITIRAVDFDGNIRESTIEIPGLVSKTELFGIILLGVFVYSGFLLYKKRK